MYEVEVSIFFLKYYFCFSIEECRNIIMQFGVREVTAAQVARVLGMMARTHSGLTDGIPLQVCCLQLLIPKDLKILSSSVY